MSSEASLIITIGATVGAAVAAIGSVEQRMTRLGEAAATLTSRQKALGDTIKNMAGPGIEGSVKRLQHEYTQLGSTIDKVRASQLKLQRQQALGADLRQARGQMRSDALDTMALGASVVVPVKLAIDFESAMADVRKVVDFETPDGLKMLGDEILKMSRTLPVAATDLAKIAASGGQLGVSAKDIPKFTETIAKMAVAFDMSAEDAGDSMAKLANVYKIPIANIGKLGDAINQLSNESPAKASDIVRTLSRVGGVAKAFGLTELQTASLSNAFIALGKPPEVAGTAINGMLMKLGTADKQGKKFQAALGELGLSATGLKQSIGKDAQGALVGFLQTLEKIPNDKRMGVLVDLFGLEYADDVAVLAGSVKTYTDSIDSLNKKNNAGGSAFDGSMEREFQTRSATTANNLQLLKNSFTELGITMGSAVLPALNELVNDIKPAIIGFSKWASENQGLVKIGFKTVAFLTAAKMGALGLHYGLNLLVSSGNSVMHVLTMLNARRLLFSAGRLAAGKSAFPNPLAAMGKFNIAGTFGRILPMIARIGPMLAGALAPVGAAIAAIGWPVVAIVAAVAAVGLVVYKYWKPIKAFFAGLWEGLKQGMTPLMPLFSKIGAAAAFMFTPLKPIWNWVVSAASTICGWFGNIFKQEEDVGNGARNMGVRVGAAIGGFITAVVKVHQVVITSFGRVISFFASLPAKFVQFGADIITGLVNGIKSKIGSAVAAIKDAASQVKSGFASLLGIKSPSRVFMEMGGWISTGAALGIESGFGRVKNAAIGLAKTASSIGLNLPPINTPRQSSSFVAQTNRGSAASTTAGGVTIHFNPTIQLSTNGKGDAQGQIQQAMQWSLRELEQMMKRVVSEQARRAF